MARSFILLFAIGRRLPAPGNPRLIGGGGAPANGPVVAETALAAPRNGILEIAGPERAPFNELVARYLKAVFEPRQVVREPEALYPPLQSPAALRSGRHFDHHLAATPLGQASHTLDTRVASLLELL